MESKKGLDAYRMALKDDIPPLAGVLEGESESWSDLSSVDKTSVMEAVDEFKRRLRETTSHKYIGRMGRSPAVHTPIMHIHCGMGYGMDAFIEDFEVGMSFSRDTLAGTPRGEKVIHDYKQAFKNQSTFLEDADPITNLEYARLLLKNAEMGNLDEEHVLTKLDQLCKVYQKVPSHLIQSDLGKRILHDLKTTTYSKPVFCHNYLCPDSFIIKDKKLVAIRNWQYAGYYPPELEDIIHRYLEYI